MRPTFVVADKKKDGFKTESSSQPTCFLCHGEGKLFYQIRGTNKNSAKRWLYYFCQGCQHLWLYPLPEPEELKDAYKNYHTHRLSSDFVPARSLRQKWLEAFLRASFGYGFLGDKSSFILRKVGKITASIPWLRRRAILAVNGVSGVKDGLLLDVGCGNGHYLKKMAELGWKVLGIEPDEQAAEIARRHFGLEVIPRRLEDAVLPKSAFDAITFRHSLEHDPNPDELLRRCFHLLRSGGKIYVLTPNVKSFGHRLFGQRWRGLEPPRHLHLYSVSSLQSTLQGCGFTDISALTTARYAAFFFQESSRLRPTLMRQIAGQLFQMVEGGLIWLKKAEGEEILVVGVKP